MIVAVPPVMAARIDFAGAAGAAGGRAGRLGDSGTVIKALVRYSRAFWRDKGLSGMVFWREPPGLFACDASQDDEHPALVMFIGGRLRRNGARSARRACGRGRAQARAALGPRRKTRST